MRLISPNYYNPETKQQSMFPYKEDLASWLIVFFDIRSMIMENWVSDGVTGIKGIKWVKGSQNFVQKNQKKRGHSWGKVAVFFIKTKLQHTLCSLSEAVSDAETHCSTWPSFLFTWFSTMWQNQVLHLKELISSLSKKKRKCNVKEV